MRGVPRELIARVFGGTQHRTMAVEACAALLTDALHRTLDSRPAEPLRYFVLIFAELAGYQPGRRSHANSTRAVEASAVAVQCHLPILGSAVGVAQRQCTHEESELAYTIRMSGVLEPAINDALAAIRSKKGVGADAMARDLAAMMVAELVQLVDSVGGDSPRRDAGVQATAPWSSHSCGWLGAGGAPSGAPAGDHSVVVDPAVVAEAVAAISEVGPLGMLYSDEHWWEELNGSLLEPALEVDARLGGAPVRLLDARFLIALAKRGGRMCRRQELPEAAFLPMKTLKQMGGDDASSTLHVIAVSHPWHTWTHCDPSGFHLRLLADCLECFVAEGTYAVFLDFMCVHQKGATGEPRSQLEAHLFHAALETMMMCDAPRPQHSRLPTAIAATSPPCQPPTALPLATPL